MTPASMEFKNWFRAFINASFEHLVYPNVRLQMYNCLCQDIMKAMVTIQGFFTQSSFHINELCFGALSCWKTNSLYSSSRGIPLDFL